MSSRQISILASSSENSDIDGGDSIAPPTKRQRLNSNILLNNSNLSTSSSNLKKITNQMNSLTNGETHRNGFKPCDHNESNGSSSNSNCNNINNTNCSCTSNANGFGKQCNSFSKQNNKQIERKIFSQGQTDILRLIGQHLRYLGLNRTTECLINESDCMLEHPTATNFCNLIMNGHWDQVRLKYRYFYFF